jgi:hypothetical protein
MSGLFELSSSIKSFIEIKGQSGLVLDTPNSIANRFQLLQQSIVERDKYVAPIRAWLLENTLWYPIYREQYAGLALEHFLMHLLGAERIPEQLSNVQTLKYINNWSIANNSEFTRIVNMFINNLPNSPKKTAVIDFIDANPLPVVFHDIINILGKHQKVPELILLCLKSIFPRYSDNILNQIITSASKKVDLTVRDDNNIRLMISVKSLVEDNKEINLGSFPPRMIFGDIVQAIPAERSELGSGRLFRQYIANLTSQQRDLYIDRINNVTSLIFNDIVPVIVKRDLNRQKLTISVVDTETLSEVITNILTNPEHISNHACRIEGNAIRMSRDTFNEYSQVIEIEP